MSIDKYLNQIFQYNVGVLRVAVEEGRQYDAIASSSMFNRIFKAIDKWISKSESHIEHNYFALESFGEVFFNAYELIYYRYFNKPFEDYLIQVTKKCKILPNGDALDWLLKFWFKVLVLQWWWYQLAHKVDYEGLTNAAVIETVTLSAVRSALNNLFVTLDLSSEFADDHPIMIQSKKLKAVFEKLNSIYEFDAIWNFIEPMRPTVNLSTLIKQANHEEFFYKMMLFINVQQFKEIIDVLISNESELPN